MNEDDLTDEQRAAKELEIYDYYWKALLEDDEGNFVDKETLIHELYVAYFAMYHYAVVASAITEGAVQDSITPAHAVMAIHQERLDAFCVQFAQRVQDDANNQIVAIRKEADELAEKVLDETNAQLAAMRRENVDLLAALVYSEETEEPQRPTKEGTDG